MTAARTGTCDGCEREGPVQQLERVILPNGETATCCPECRYHAEQLAADATAQCEGCGESVTAADLRPTELPDGTELSLCSDCRDQVSAEDGTVRAGAVDASDVADRVGSNGSADAASADSGTGASTDTDRSGSERRGAAASGSGGPSGATASTGSAATGSDPEAAATADDAADTTDRPATTRNACDQCGNLFSIELYQVTTVDGRTEQFCPDCKEAGVKEGIVRDVELRRAQAFEVLGIAGSASEDEIREAYLRKVKEVHPDRADGNRSEFMLVQEAYDRLSDD